MADTEQHKLDADFTLIAVDDQGDVPVHTRPPNVVSRRGHALKIIAQIRDVPNEDFPVDVSIIAQVSVLGNPNTGDEGDVSRLSEFWGRSGEPAMGTIFSRDQLPLRLQIIVPKTNEDDHLGQGPDYEATVDITAGPSPFNPEVEAAGAGRKEEEAAQPERTARNSTPGNGSFIIPFSSR
jgi:hypothetical protein